MHMGTNAYADIDIHICTLLISTCSYLIEKAYL